MSEPKQVLGALGRRAFLARRGFLTRDLAAPAGVERGNSIFGPLARTGENTRSATVGQHGLVGTRGVTPLLVGMRADISRCCVHS